jgi:hypothetical protein
MEWISILLLGGYLWGIWGFWRGFKHTNFNQSLPTKFSLSLLWPVLIVSNKSYRQNFKKALKG